MTEPLLEVDNVSKQFGDVVALEDVSFTINSDTGVTALIGPNGAGKTTLYNVLSGKLAPTAGRVRFQADDITDKSTAERSHLGLGRSFQITNVFDGLTVRQNLRIPIVAHSDARRDVLSPVDDRDDLNDQVDETLELIGLSDISNQSCNTLSYGDKRRVEIGVALATDPDLLLLDEPTAGMNPNETGEMVRLIEHLNEETDTSFFITEHDMNVVFSIASRVLVLNRGRIIADEQPAAIQQNDQVQAAYLGGSDETGLLGGAGESAAERPASRTEAEPLLAVRDIHTFYGESHVLDGVSLDVHEGEIVAILGRNGAGKTTTLRSITGLTPARNGEIRFAGNPITHAAPYEIARAGIGFVPEERQIFTDLSVEDNLTIRLDESTDWPLERIYDVFPVLEEKATKKGYQLSGGEQQMLTVARALVTDPDLLVLDEPSEGLAPVIVDDLREVLQDIIDTGITVLLTEQNIEFALSLSDRNYVLNKGTIEWHGTTGELADNREILDKHISLSEVEDAAY